MVVRVIRNNLCAWVWVYSWTKNYNEEEGETYCCRTSTKSEGYWGRAAAVTCEQWPVTEIIPTFIYIHFDAINANFIVLCNKDISYTGNWRRSGYRYPFLLLSIIGPINQTVASDQFSLLTSKGQRHYNMSAYLNVKSKTKKLVSSQKPTHMRP